MINQYILIIKNEIEGIKINMNFEENMGINCSFINNFTPSSIACKNPINLTLLGPRRICLSLKT